MTDTPTVREGENAFVRLRRRKVVQWGLAYAAGAWGLLQGLEYVIETFHWPQSIRQFTLLALLIGLPIVLILAWYHGDRGQQRVTGIELTIVTLLFALGGIFFWRYEPVTETPATTGSKSAVTTASTVDIEVPTAPPPDSKSIAVLPFADMSPGKDQEYMADGMADELLNLLAKAPDLKVIARTSSFAFKGEKIDIAEVARRLNVAHVLEGSIRTSGDKIRVTAQLIRASDRTHLWSETYDRPLDDIFTVQDEIADAIVQALQIKLMGGSLNRREGGTQNLEAHLLYLRAVSAMNQYSRVTLDAAGDYLDEAIRIDPNYGRAWLALADTVGLKVEIGVLPPKEGYERVRQLAQHALVLSPDLAGAHAALQGVDLYFLDWAAAASEGKKALAIDPTDPSALQMNAVLAYTLGQWDDAERQLRAALARDPLEPFVVFSLGRLYYGSGRLEQSEAQYRRVLELAPDFLGARAYLGKTLLASGDPDAALVMVQQEVERAARTLYLPIVLQAVGRQDEADETLNTLIREWGHVLPYYVAQNYAYRGDHDRALEWLERAYQQKDIWLFEILGEPLFNNLAGDPRFKAFLRKMNLPDRWPRPTTDD